MEETGLCITALRAGRAGYMKGCRSLMGLALLTLASHISPDRCTEAAVQCAEDGLAKLQLCWN